ncbi:MAG: hypothetical protein FD174_327 [Geobacteraceae bacterium]|nr:MAG: hypothetical protein FD174_327 [Geobacteraceae bacterium]
MKGILRIAYKLLVNDKGKFAALLVGITFAVFLMVMMMSMFAGILHRSSATVINIGAKVCPGHLPSHTVIPSSLRRPSSWAIATASSNSCLVIRRFRGGWSPALKQGRYWSMMLT